MRFDYDYHGPNQNHLIILKVKWKSLPKLPWFTTFVVDFFFIFSFTLDAISQFVPRPAGWNLLSKHSNFHKSLLSCVICITLQFNRTKEIAKWLIYLSAICKQISSDVIFWISIPMLFWYANPRLDRNTT